MFDRRFYDLLDRQIRRAAEHRRTEGRRMAQAIDRAREREAVEAHIRSYVRVMEAIAWDGIYWP